MITKHQENLITDFEANPPNNKSQVVTLILKLQEGIMRNNNKLWNSHSNLTFKDLEDLDNLEQILLGLSVKELHNRTLRYIKAFYETHNKVLNFKKQFKYSI